MNIIVSDHRGRVQMSADDGAMACAASICGLTMRMNRPMVTVHLVIAEMVSRKIYEPLLLRGTELP